jgi:hypothetical protein
MHESHAEFPDSDSRGGAGLPPPRGIEILIDILAREALQVAIAKHLRLQAREDLRQEKASSGKRAQSTSTRGSSALQRSNPVWWQDPRQTY